MSAPEECGNFANCIFSSEETSKEKQGTSKDVARKKQARSKKTATDFAGKEGHGSVQVLVRRTAGPVANAGQTCSLEGERVSRWTARAHPMMSA
ncbi:MAG: hypothetical protein ACE5QW_04700 [Thermoplasmata archaeon]